MCDITYMVLIKTSHGMTKKTKNKKKEKKKKKECYNIYNIECSCIL